MRPCNASLLVLAGLLASGMLACVTPQATPLPRVPGRCSAGNDEGNDGLPVRAIDVVGLETRAHVKDARSRTGPLTADDVRAYLRQRPGRPFKRAWLDRDVLAIYDSGYFWGVGADATCANGEMTIRLHVSELPVVASVKVLMPDGTSVVDDPSKGGPIQTYPGSVFSYAVIAHDRKALADALERRGKPSDVTYRTRWFEPNDVEVTFEVSPAPTVGRSP